MLNGPKTSEFLAEYWKPEIDFAIEAFGPERTYSRPTTPKTGT